MKKALWFSIVLGIVGGLSFTLLFLTRTQPALGETIPVPIVSETVPATPAPTPVPTPVATRPVVLSIPKLNISASVEYVGLDEYSRMDVPKNPANVAWYELGPKPGETGSAVIAGHLDTPQGRPAVFYNLTSLQPGDTLTITDENGKVLPFTVERVTAYEDATFPIAEVFSKSDTKRLNLITCGGTYDRTARNYTHRTVVFAVFEP